MSARRTPTGPKGHWLSGNLGQFRRERFRREKGIAGRHRRRLLRGGYLGWGEVLRARGSSVHDGARIRTPAAATFMPGRRG